MRHRPSLLSLPLILVLSAGCGGNEADDEKIGGECSSSAECENEELTCLTEFAGGYCGAEDCTENADCPDGSICVDHEVGGNFCFLTCVNKEDCNRNRSVENESNCVSSIVRVDAGNEKACVPPSSGL